MSKHSLQVLKDFNISQYLFDTSIEYHNDEEILDIIENLTAVKSKKPVEFSKDTVLSILEFYMKTENDILKELDSQTYDAVLVRAIIEDKIWHEFGIELTDFIHYCESQVQDKDIELKFEDLRNSMTSLQKLDNRFFK